MLTDLMIWWAEQMRDLVPASFRGFGHGGRRLLVVAAPEGPVVDLILRGRSGEVALGRHELGGATLREAVGCLPAALRQSITLLVPPVWLLEKHMTLPLAAEHNLGRVVAYEMDRLTPFAAEDVLWSCLAERRDAARGRLHVRITLVPRALVQPVLDGLHQAGLAVVGIEAAGGNAAGGAIALAGANGASAWLGKRAQAWMSAACAILAATAIALPFVLQAVALDDIDSRIEALRPGVAEAERLRGRIAAFAATADAIADARAQVGPSLQLIAVLTEVLADDTYLTLLTARQRKLAISGRSATAARLIGAMAAHKLIQNPSFAAPVIRDEASGRETFSIRAELAR